MVLRMHAALRCAVLGFGTSVMLVTLLGSVAALQAQVPLPALIPKVDTMWTRSVSASDYVEFHASDIGGDVPTLVVAATRNTTERERRQVLILFDPKTGDSLQCIESGHYSSIRDVVFAANANVVATAEHGRIKLWSWPDFRVLREFGGSSQALPRVLLSHDGRRLFNNLDGIMYDTECGDTLWRFVTVFDATKTRPSMTPDERYILTVRTEYIRPRDVGVMLDASTGYVCDIFYGGNGADDIASIAVSDDARYVAVSRLPHAGPPFRPGSCVVYDRHGDSVLSVITLNGDPDTDGQRCRFLPYDAGLLLYRNLAGAPKGDYLYPIRGADPFDLWWPFFEQRFTRDWSYQFGANGRHAWVGPFAMPRSGVALPLSEYASMCVDDDGRLHVSGIEAADGAAAVEAVTYDGRRCLDTDVTIDAGRCTIDVAVLRGPAYVTVSRSASIIARGAVFVP